MEDAYDQICNTGARDVLDDRPETFRKFTDRFSDWVYQLGRREAIWMIAART